MTGNVLGNPVMWCILALAAVLYFQLIREILQTRSGCASRPEASWSAPGATLIATLPLLGLLGTIGGLLQAFHALAQGGGGDIGASLAAGISSALFTTQWGLMTAIPAWFLRQWLIASRRRLDYRQ
ncbi:MotA/TolQ/ExbB proton channel family protein [Parahaliea mediterranea]|uniref:MotA/TolQ/ExbB proton channel family protein n=1 Tax=Parahaliea mediterranea TaxID=651086 RepID=UPI000E2F3A70|nr:MotA/TolQ/ExbB proton channel family protein [Parahaliea mediterranea]